MDTTTLEPRIANPAFAVPGAMDALQAMNKAISRARISQRTLELMHPKIARKLGETDDRIFAVAAWRDAPFFTDAERAALALTEAVTRLADTADPVPDSVWEHAARHYDEQELAALVLSIATVNVWNRLNVATRQVAGQEW
jgi:alkylhydroperoxidase family enzyme